MKKNVMMRIASFLLIAVLISTSAISGTYAKYVTSGESSDDARVAKFGVKVSADYEAAFTRGYKLADVVSTENESEASVWADAEVDVVAPGTSGELADFVVTGQPEVDVAVTYEATLTLDKWTVTDDENYCPIVFTVNSDEYYIGASTKYGEITTVLGLQNAVMNAIEESTKTYDAGTNLADVVKNDLAVSWAWKFEGVNEGGDGPAIQFDKKDTELGDKAAAGDAATIELAIKCTITQID